MTVAGTVVSVDALAALFGPVDAPGTSAAQAAVTAAALPALAAAADHTDLISEAGTVFDADTIVLVAEPRAAQSPAPAEAAAQPAASEPVTALARALASPAASTPSPQPKHYFGTLSSLLGRCVCIPNCLRRSQPDEQPLLGVVEDAAAPAAPRGPTWRQRICRNPLETMRQNWNQASRAKKALVLGGSATLIGITAWNHWELIGDAFKKLGSYFSDGVIIVGTPIANGEDSTTSGLNTFLHDMGKFADWIRENPSTFGTIVAATALTGATLSIFCCGSRQATPAAAQGQAAAASTQAQPADAREEKEDSDAESVTATLHEVRVEPSTRAQQPARSARPERQPRLLLTTADQRAILSGTASRGKPRRQRGRSTRA